MSDLLCKINIGDIDLADERYKFSSAKDDITFLAHSIRQAGLLTPPIVRPLNNKFIIISGFNRVRALIYNNQVSNHKTKILVYETNPDITECQCLIKSIAALAFQRPLTHAELIISTRRLYQFMDKNEITKKSPAIFNRELNVRFVEDLLNIGALSDLALALIQSGNLSFKSAKRIASYEKETLEIFINIFSKIKASSNKQLEIILHIMEIAARDGIKPLDLYKNQEIQAILFDEDKEPGMKTKALRAWLFEQRFPAIFKMHQDVHERITSIKLGNKIKFSPPQNFESQDYLISFTAKNHKEFVANVQKLYAALENKDLKEIFNP